MGEDVFRILPTADLLGTSHQLPDFTTRELADGSPTPIRLLKGRIQLKRKATDLPPGAGGHQHTSGLDAPLQGRAGLSWPAQ